MKYTCDAEEAAAFVEAYGSHAKSEWIRSETSAVAWEIYGGSEDEIMDSIKKSADRLFGRED